jgi:hypothetical protein
VRATGPPCVVDDDLVAHDPRVPVLDGSRAAGEPVPTNIRLEETTSKPSRASTCRRAALGGSSSNAACTVPVDQPAPASATNWCAAGPSAQRRTGLGRTAATSTQTFQATGGAPPATSLLEDTETQVSDLSGLSQRRLPESDRLAVRCPEEPVRRSLPFDGRRCRPFRRRGPPRSNPPPGRLTWNIGRAVPRRRPEPGPPRGRPTPYGRRCGGRRHRRSVRYGRRRLRRSR